VTIAVVIPALDEAENLVALVPEVVGVVEAEGGGQVVVVDDGSTDGTEAVLAELAERFDCVHPLRLRRNAGKSAALQVGLDRSKGDVVVLLDADGQDDPADIPELLAALRAGADLATGARTGRPHERIVKRTTSRLFNRITSWITRVPGHDFNCGLKAMRRDVADRLDLYGELHRYIPVLAARLGFRVVEVPVANRPRLHGRTKFGAARFWRGALDLLTVKFLTTWDTRPAHLFGGLGLICGTAGGGLLAWMLVLRVEGETVGNRPALLAGLLLTVVAVQLFVTALLSELVVHQRRRAGSGLGALVVDPREVADP
jgi:glycosyltransferase involved in cell wall biosynthesis